MLLTSAVSANELDTSHREKFFPGYVTHGINNFNDKLLMDYSQVSPGIAILNLDPPVKEIGAFNAGGTEASVINENTDRDLPLATTSSFFRIFNPNGTLDQSLVNKTLDMVGSNYFGFTSVADRIVPKNFEDVSGGEIYRSNKINLRPTVGDWEQISGQLRVKCKDNGTSTVTIGVRDAFPNSVYTLWEIGVKTPLSETESVYGIPLGGIPNVMVTDNRGCGYKKVNLPYCLVRACEAGAVSCTSYVSAFYHWDGQVYGGSPTATWAGAPGGIYSSNQIVWPTSGIPLEEPFTRMNSNKLICHSTTE